MRKTLLLAFGILAAASVSGAAFAQVQAAQNASAGTSFASTLSVPPISDQQLSQELGPSLGLVVGAAQQLINMGDKGVAAGQADSRPAASQPGGQLSSPGAGASSPAGLQSGLSPGLGLLPAPRL